MAHRVVRAHFEAFAKAKMDFARAAEEMCGSADALPSFLAEGGTERLLELLLDAIPSVRHSAATALSHLADISPDLATELAENRAMLSHLMGGLAGGRSPSHASSCSVVRAIGQHSQVHADACIEVGALEALVSVWLLRFEGG